MTLKNFTFKISAFMNYVVNYIYIHYTVQEKLILMYWNFNFFSISRLFAVEVRQRWKQLLSSVAETTASFYNMCNHRAL
jgi:hypothetical protein